MVDREVQYVTRVFKAIQECDLVTFGALVGTEEHLRWTASQKQALLDARNYENENNTVAHELLVSRSRWSFFWRWLREGAADYFWLFLSKEYQSDQQFSMLQALFQESDFKKTINHANLKGDTPLHMAVANGADTIVKKLLETGADLTAVDAQNRTALHFAAELGKHEIYEKILSRSEKNAKNNKVKNSYTLEQLQLAKKAYSENLSSKKNKAMKVLGTIMSIACPVGAIFAFFEWPLLEVFFTMLLGSAGIFVGIGGAVLMAGLLYWTFHTKAEKKYGEHAQKVLELKSALCQIDHLKSRLNHVLKLEQQQGPSRELQDEKQSILYNLNLIYREKVPANFKKEERPSLARWATTTDVIQTYASVAGGFLCAFSGMLGILGGAASFIPETALLSAVCLGVPVAGWCALAIALAVCAVGLWVYSSRIQKAIHEKGESRKEVYDLEKKLFNGNEEFKSLKQSLTKTSNPITYRDKRNADDRFVSHNQNSKSSPASSFATPLSPAQLINRRGVLKVVPGQAAEEVERPQSTVEVAAC